jgi:hypothetical protein
MSTCASAADLKNARADRLIPSSLTLTRLRWFVTAALLALATVLISAVTAHAQEQPSPPQHACDVGVFCAWADEGQRGTPHFADLRTAALEKCIPLNGFEARSFINNMQRPVTVYQTSDCSTEADFTTYPAGASIPRAPFVGRAITIWTH